MAAQLKRRKFTVTEFYRMVPACILGEDTLEELIDGDVMVRALKTRRHSNTVSKLFGLFISGDILGCSPSAQCPIRLDDYNEPVADLALLSLDFDSMEHPDTDDVLLAIEVADTYAEAEYDRNIKLPLYARYGLPELWLVMLQPGAVEVHRVAFGDSYREVVQYGQSDTLTVQSLPDVRLTVGELLQ